LIRDLFMSGRKHQAADDIPLVPFEDFKKSVRKILWNTKADSDRQLAEFQASNLRKRRAKKQSGQS